MKTIKSLPSSARPREKLLKSGAASLSTQELYAVILITGTKSASVTKLTATLLKLAKKQILTKELLLQQSFGAAKTAQILAVQELAIRITDASKIITPKKAEDIYALAFEITAAQKETLLCFYLNARGELIKKETIAVGTLNQVHLLPREIFSLVKELPVASIILVHNHPSGNLEPSADDLHFTQRVKLAGELLGVTLLDHLIVAKTGWKRIPLT